MPATSKPNTVPERVNAAGASSQLAREFAFDAFKALAGSDLIPFPVRDHAARIVSELDAFQAELALFNSGLAQSDGGHR